MIDPKKEKDTKQTQDPEFPEQGPVETIVLDHPEERVCSPEFPAGCQDVED